ncbi:hypothetical protein J2X72_004898 [Phyllobacterium sp. 1468]|nr:hypothetical protein [Phyllobacterium sp. 1468]
MLGLWFQAAWAECNAVLMYGLRSLWYFRKCEKVIHHLGFLWMKSAANRGTPAS